MPAYSFKQQFVPMVKKGTKRQTIRARRKKGYAKVGDILYLYFGMRTKWCSKIKQAKCKKAGSVMILECGKIILWDNRLSDEEVQNIYLTLPFFSHAPDYISIVDPFEKNSFAWDDGFRPKGSTKDNPKGSHDLMMKFWKQTHDLPFIGDIIYW